MHVYNHRLSIKVSKSPNPKQLDTSSARKSRKNPARTHTRTSTRCEKAKERERESGGHRGALAAHIYTRSRQTRTHTAATAREREKKRFAMGGTRSLAFSLRLSCSCAGARARGKRRAAAPAPAESWRAPRTYLSARVSVREPRITLRLQRESDLWMEREKRWRLRVGEWERERVEARWAARNFNGRDRVIFWGEWEKVARSSIPGKVVWKWREVLVGKVAGCESCLSNALFPSISFCIYLYRYQ